MKGKYRSGIQNTTGIEEDKLRNIFFKCKCKTHNAQDVYDELIDFINKITERVHLEENKRFLEMRTIAKRELENINMLRIKMSYLKAKNETTRD